MKNISTNIKIQEIDRVSSARVLQILKSEGIVINSLVFNPCKLLEILGHYRINVNEFLKHNKLNLV